MASYAQQHTLSSVYPPPSMSSYPAPAEGYPAAYVAPPPAGYPMKNDAAAPYQGPVETKSRGEGFWEGCCAALCCCCVLDICF